ncbi:unnamed protein product [Linum tenue]|uniref:Aminotransferase-like plant mobile domain-containing protein n=1 Tax=Linum tenue TaxID=586396 RepID=A0AAV0KQN1_9ROSI|nr:unnamed protein product [Linum tenue]
MRRTTRRSIAVAPLAEEDVRSSVTSFSTKFSLPTFVKRVGKLTDDQISLIKKTGFGNLLLLPNHIVSKTLLVELMDRWDQEKLGFELGSGTMSITLMDVALILGLPVVGDPVILKDDEPFSELEMEFAASSKRKISISSLESRLDSLDKTCNEDFVRTFLLYTMGVLLFPNSSGNVDSRYLSFLQELDDVCDIAWGAAVLEDILVWLKKRKETGTQSMGGCLIFLQVWSYEHIDIARPNLLDTEMTFPRVCRWQISKSHQKQWFANKFTELEDHQVVWELEPTPEEQTQIIVRDLLRIQNGDYELLPEQQSYVPNTPEAEVLIDSREELEMESPNMEELQASTSSSESDDHQKHPTLILASDESHMKSPNADKNVAAAIENLSGTTMASERDEQQSVDMGNQEDPGSNSKLMQEEVWRRSSRSLREENTKLKEEIAALRETVIPVLQEENATLRERVTVIPVLEEEIARLKDQVESLIREDQMHRFLAEEFDYRMSAILLEDDEEDKPQI